MVLKTTYKNKATQTKNKNEDTIEELLRAITTFCTEVDSMDNDIEKPKTNEDNLKSKANISQQHDYKKVELRRLEDGKILEIERDDRKLPKTHNVCLNIAASISRKVSEKPQNTNLNQLIVKPFINNTPKQIPIETKTSTYVVSIQNESEKKRYNYITQTYK